MYDTEPKFTESFDSIRVLATVDVIMNCGCAWAIIASFQFAEDGSINHAGQRNKHPCQSAYSFHYRIIAIGMGTGDKIHNSR